MLGMKDIRRLLERWQLDVGDVRERMYRAPTPRGRERWHGVWLLAQGWTALAVAEAFRTRAPHHRHVGRRLKRQWSHSPGLRAVGWFPPAFDGDQQAQLKAAVQALPEKAGIDLANWNWKVVRRFVQERFGLSLSSSSCLNYLHRLGFVLKRPKKHFLKADEAKREAFVAAYAALLVEARQLGTKVFFADEAHFRADADLRGKWVLIGRAGAGRFDQPTVGRKGQLLFGGVPGDRRGGDYGTAEVQQRRNLDRFPEATAG